MQADNGRRERILFKKLWGPPTIVDHGVSLSSAISRHKGLGIYGKSMQETRYFYSPAMRELWIRRIFTLNHPPPFISSLGISEFDAPFHKQ